MFIKVATTAKVNIVTIYSYDFDGSIFLPSIPIYRINLTILDLVENSRLNTYTELKLIKHVY